MQPSVLISIINYNSTSHSLECLKSLKSLDYKDYKVYIADNASKEDVSPIKKQFPDVIFNQNKENLGFTGAHNQAFNYAIKNKIKYVLLLNPDLVADSHFLSELIKIAESDSSIGIVGGNIYSYINPNKLVTSGGYISFITGIGYESKRSKNNEIQELTNIHEYFDGCCLLLRTDMLKKIGLYDEKYFLYNETEDLCIRARKAGFKIMHNPHAKVWHKGYGSSGGKKSPIPVFYMVRNRHLFIKKFFPKRYVLFLLSIIPVFLIQSFLFLAKGQISLIYPMIKANLNGLFNNFNRYRFKI